MLADNLGHEWSTLGVTLEEKRSGWMILSALLSVFHRNAQMAAIPVDAGNGSSRTEAEVPGWRANPSALRRDLEHQCREILHSDRCKHPLHEQ